MKSINLLWLMVLTVIMVFAAGNAYSAAVELPQTGQTTSYAAGDDGDLQMGVAWPLPRFVNNGDGTITDDLTGLVWLQNANCYGVSDWKVAFDNIFVLADGTCELTDGSSAGDWRMPNYNEMESLIGVGDVIPTWLGTAGFTNLQGGANDFYWVSTIYLREASYPWVINMGEGRFSYWSSWDGGSRNENAFVLPVRGTAEGTGTVDLPATGDDMCVYRVDATVWAVDPDCTALGTGTWAPVVLEDGALQMGVALPTTGISPSGRYSNNYNGTITDLVTDFLWTQSGNVVLDANPAGTGEIDTWQGALDFISDMNNGTNLSLLCPGPVPCENYGYTDWRLPNRKEMMSLLYFGDLGGGYIDDWLESEGFVNVSTAGPASTFSRPDRAGYWTSTTDPANTANIFGVTVDFGEAHSYSTTSTIAPQWHGHGSVNFEPYPYFIWPVRDTATAPYGLGVDISPQGKGSITGTGIACPADCSEIYDIVTPVVLTANPYVGSVFDSWTGCDSAVDNVCTMNMDETKGVIANFEVPDIAVDPTTIPFGNVNVGLAVERDITVTNNDVVDFPLGTITIAGDITQFSIVTEDCSGKNLEASGGDDTCSITVGFSPTATGLFNGTIDIPPLAVVALTGTGSDATGPDIAVTSNALDFTNTPVSTTSVQTVTVTNDGSANLTISSITGSSLPFSEDYLTDCGALPITLAAGASCDIDVTYTAPAAPQGPDISSIDIASDDPDEDPVTINLLGSTIGGGNNPPEKPILLSPVNGSTTTLPASFEWEDAIDPDGDPLTHTLYLATDPGFQNLVMPVADLSNSDVSYAMVLGNPVFMIALFGLAAFGVFLRRKKIALIIIAVMFTGLLLASCSNHKDVAGGGGGGGGTGGGVLQAGTTYYWMVVADDGNGGVTPSDIWSFPTAP